MSVHNLFHTYEEQGTTKDSPLFVYKHRTDKKIPLAGTNVSLQTSDEQIEPKFITILDTTPR